MKPESDSRPTGIPSDPDELLALSENLRRLAVHLVGDGNAADDLVQDAWLAALDEGAPRARDLTAWLKGVVARLAKRGHVRSRRRAELERLNAARDAVVDESSLVEGLSTYRLLRETIKGLRQPYCEILMERYLEDRSMEDLARERGCSESTLRSQLWRGMQELREALDRKHEGDRAGWSVLVLPLIRGGDSDRKLVSRAAPMPLGVWAVLAGAVVVLLSVWQLNRSEPDPVEVGDRDSLASVSTPVDEPQQAPVSERSPAAEEVPAKPSSAEAATPIAEDKSSKRRLTVRGLASDGLPLRELWLRRVGGEVEGPFEGNEIVLELEEDELIVHEDPESPGIRFAIRGPQSAWSATAFVPVPGAGREVELQSRGPGLTLTGVVLDEHGDPAPRARLVCAAGIRTGTLRRPDGVSEVVFPEVATADEAGNFRMEGLVRGDSYQLYVKASRSATGSRMVESDLELLDLELSLPPSGVLVGQVSRPDGSAAAGARVWYPGARFAAFGLDAEPVFADEAGRYELPGLSAGVHHIFACDPEEETLFASALPRIEAGVATTWDAQLRVHSGLSLRVLDQAGMPVKNSLGFAYRQADKPNWGQRFYTDEEGRATIAQVPEVLLAVLVKVGASDAVEVLRDAKASDEEYVVEYVAPSAARGRLSGVILDHTGAPFEQARVGAVAGWDLFFVDVHPNSGEFEAESVVARKWAFQVFAQGFGAYELGEFEVHPETGLDLGRVQLPAPVLVELQWEGLEPSPESPWTMNAERPNRKMSTRPILTLESAERELWLLPGRYQLGPLSDLRTWPLLVSPGEPGRLSIAAD